MFRPCFLVIFSLLALSVFSQQKTWVSNKDIIVKDSSGYRYKPEEWRPLLASKEYTTVLVDSTDSTKSYIIKPITEEMREKMFAKSPKPKQSESFQTGKKYAPLKAKTINGDKISSRELKGKILVINYWFIDCMPCRMEIPELNALVKKFEKDTNIVFIALARDSKHDLEKFLDETPFSYQVVAGIAGNGISSYPTNVVVDTDGKVYFHTSGYGPYSVYWIRKSIEELKSGIGKQKSEAGSQNQE